MGVNDFRGAHPEALTETEHHADAGGSEVFRKAVEVLEHVFPLGFRQRPVGKIARGTFARQKPHFA